MKGLGLLLVFSVPFGAGIFFAWSRLKGRRLERALVELMEEGEKRIRHSLCPRDLLFVRLESRPLWESGFLPALQEAGRKAAAPWEVWKRFEGELGISKEMKECLSRYFSHLGDLPYEAQLRHCRDCVQEGKALIREKEPQLRDRVKLDLTLGAALGAFLAIMLL